MADGIETLGELLGPLRVASLYENAALALPGSARAQPPFLNTAVIALRPATDDPETLLALAKQLELRAGRHRGPRWAARVLDVDLLLAGKHRRREAALTLPHPGLRSRRFVLAPLAEIAPRLAVPPDGARVADLLAALDPSAPPVARRPWPLASSAS